VEGVGGGVPIDSSLCRQKRHLSARRGFPLLIQTENTPGCIVTFLLRSIVDHSIQVFPWAADQTALSTKGTLRLPGARSFQWGAKVIQFLDYRQTLLQPLTDFGHYSDCSSKEHLLSNDTAVPNFEVYSCDRHTGIASIYSIFYSKWPQGTSQSVADHKRRHTGMASYTLINFERQGGLSSLRAAPARQHIWPPLIPKASPPVAYDVLTARSFSTKACSCHIMPSMVVGVEIVVYTCDRYSSHIWIGL